jgi:hypothetical protein
MAKLGWDKAGKRWKKIYRGKPFYGKRGVKKSDDNARRLAEDDFENWRKETDKELDVNKPSAVNMNWLFPYGKRWQIGAY